MQTKIPTTVLPCAPGWRLIFKQDDDKKLFVGEHIVGWLVSEDDGVQSLVPGHGVDEDPESFFGHMSPDGAVHSFDYSVPFKDLETAEASCYRR